MSKTELLYNKILKASMIVAVISLGLLIIDLFFAVTTQAIKCSGGSCTIDSSETFFRVTVWMLIVFVIIFFIIARIMLFILTRESKLESASDYKNRMEDQSMSSDFSESELYEEIKGNRISSTRKRMKRKKSTRTVGKVFSDTVDSTKEFFSDVYDKSKEFSSKANSKTKELIILFKEKQKIKKGERAVVKESKLADKKVKAAEKEAARIEKEKILAAEREIKIAEQKELAKIEAKKQEEIELEKAKEKESRDKEALLLAKLRENEQNEKDIEKDKSEEDKEYFTRLNKTELIALVAKASDLSKAKCKLVVNAFLNVVIDELSEGNDVNIGKFGKFKKVTIKETKEVNKKTGKVKIIPKENNVNFLPDKVFKDMITNDIEATSDKNLFTKKVMKEMTEDEVQEQLIKEEKSKEHLEFKILEKEKADKLAKQEAIEKEKAKQKAIADAEKQKAIAEAVKAAQLIKQKELDAKKAKQKEEVKPVESAKPAKPTVIKKTKADIIEYIEEQTGISKNKSNKFLKFFAEVVKEELSKGKDVNISGFGLFTTIEMPAKEAVNPQTNKKIIVPAHKQARLRFDDKFKKNFEVK